MTWLWRLSRRRLVLALVLILVGAACGVGGQAMPNDIPDFANHPQQFKRALYPDGAPPSSPPTPSFTVPASGTVSNRFTLPDGTVAVRFMVTASGTVFQYRLYVGGHQTVEQYWGNPNGPGSPQIVPTPALPFTIPVDRDWDSQIDVSLVNLTASGLNVYVSALFLPEQPGQAGAAASVTLVPGTVPAPVDWQAFNKVSGAGTATCGSGSAVNKVAVLDEVTFTVICGTGRGFNVRVWDGASGTTQIGGAAIGDFPAVQATSSIMVQLHHLKSTGGNPLTFDFDFPCNPSEQQLITASGYFE